MKRTNRNKQSNNPTTSTPIRRKLRRIFNPMAILIMLGLALGYIIGANLFKIITTMTADTVVQISAEDIAPQSFTDSNVMNFITADGIPDVNNNREIQDVAKLGLRYKVMSGPYVYAFEQSLTSNELNSAIKITPHIKGRWTANYPFGLEFTPESDWPAGTTFRVKMNKKIFNGDVRPESRTIKFETVPIAAKMDSFNIYPVPNTPRTVVGVAIVSFNYPVKTNDFTDLVSMRLDGKKINFSVKFDRYRRTAFIISDPVAINDRAQTMRLKLGRVMALYGDDTTKKISATTTIEAADNLFKIQGITTAAADDARGNAQQLILINMTAAAAGSTKWARHVDAYLLPRVANRAEEQSHRWQTDEITPDVLRTAQKLTLTPIDFANPTGVYQYALSYDVSDKDDRYIYVSVGAGIESAGGLTSKNQVARVLAVPYPEKIVKIAGSGVLLSLAGERKLGIMARGGADTAYINVYKVKSHEINHLISQTYGLFSSDMHFDTWNFGVYDIASVFQKRISFADASMKRTNYASLDLGDYLDRSGTDKTGIFIIQAGPDQEEAQYSDKRLILLTNLGIIRKRNLDDSSTLFIANIEDGSPVPYAEVSVLGRNGNAIWAGRTDATGRADVPKFAPNEYDNEKEPVAFVARVENDVSFIPYSPSGTQVDYSKFDIDGAYATNTVPMNAFIFTDRGIYRPGEAAIIAGIVKNKSFQNLAGVPIKLEITDPRGRPVFEEIFSLTADGMFDIKYNASDSAVIGDYTARLYSLNNHNKPRDVIGTTFFKVEEFVPDNLKITATVPGRETPDAWISPDDMTAEISLRNLFGTPAANRRVSVHASLSPIEFTFPRYRQYTFTQNYIAGTGLSQNTARRAQTFSVDLPDVKTDENGNASVPVKFDRTIPSGTYLLTLTARGFEGGGGKSVQTSITARTSDAQYLVGWHANGDLGYVSRGATRRVNFVAVSSNGDDTSANGLTMRLIHRENLVSLVKDYNDYYKYQTVTRDQVIDEQELDIAATGTDIDLNTTSGGTYFLQITNGDGRVLANIEYFVAADENTALRTDAHAEMQVKLNSTEFTPGANIAVSITAPYAGAGLITIERDRVYAYKWFRSSTTSSVQYITLPADFEGTGYVNVSFVRDINSPDIFTTPYAYAVAPFSANTTTHRIGVSLRAPTVIHDNNLTIEYETDRNARIMIFGIDDGILQVARYKLPNPIAHFFQKSALQVYTYQVLSLLLPEYKILHEYAKTGGGDYDGSTGELTVPLTNPFGRKTNRPVAFYSGIINTSANTPANITFNIPEYFNGNVRIFAVATNENAVGAADTETLVQSPIVISTSAPLAAAPGDTFDVNAVISNLTSDSGADARAVLTADVSNNLIQTTTRATDINIPESQERLWTFGIQTTDKLGNADIRIGATILNPNGTALARRVATATLSVRPTTTFHTFINTGYLRSKSVTAKKFAIDLYPEFSTRKLYLSRGGGGLMRPLFEYLRHYDYPCTEQLVSRTMPYALSPADGLLGTKYEDSSEKIDATISALKNRQNDDGSFDLWGARPNGPGERTNAHTAYLTAYVVQFMNLARDAGFNIPPTMTSRAIDYLRSYAAGRIEDEFDAYAHAFAIYVITSNGYVTTGYIDTFEEYVSANIKNWESTLMGAYIATSYKILKQNAKASDLMSKYKLSSSSHFEFENEFLNNVANDSAYAYLRGRYFDASPTAPGTAILSYINGGQYSSYTSAMVILGLSRGATTALSEDTATVRIDGRDVMLYQSGGALVADIPANSGTLEIHCPTCSRTNGLFHTIMQQGFPRIPVAASNGIEIRREYYNTNGDRITSARVGDIITVKIFARSRAADTIKNAVITDLIPGGIAADAITDADVDFSEIREDRILAYADITRTGLTITYTAQVVAAGTFNIPPIYAESMYNPAINGTGDTGNTFTVHNAVVE